MHNNFSIKSKKSLTILFGTMFWIGALAILSSLTTMFSPPADEAATLEDSIIGCIFFVVWTLIMGALWSQASRKVQLHGSRVTFTEGHIKPKSWTIDLANVTHIAATPSFGTQTEHSVLLFATHEDTSQKFSLKFYKQEDRERFLPIIKELLSRHDVKLEGENFEQVLRGWFGDKAPTLPSPASPHRTVPRPKTSSSRLLLTWVSCAFAVLLLPAIITGYILGSRSDEHILDQRGQQTAATISSKRHSWRSRAAASHSLVVTHTGNQSEPTKAWLYVTGEYHQQVSVGDTVAITYDPQDPTRARLADTRYVKPYWKSVREVAIFITPLYIIIMALLVYNLRKERKSW